HVSSQSIAAHRDLHSFPTRRSSDLESISFHGKQGNRTGNSIKPHFSRAVGFALGDGQSGRRTSIAKSITGPLTVPAGAFRVCSRSEEHTSELQSRENLVCRLLLEKK